MVLGKDVRLDWVEDFTHKVVVGIFEYISPSRAKVVKWITKQWKPWLRYIPRYITLMKGWVCFHFKSEIDVNHILEGMWSIGKGSLVFSRWHVTFNPLKETIIKRHMWMLLPGFLI